ncbi:hypothetical protein B0H66DRAFT_563013 [Apodospora peruviana]|uniref:Galactose oxidase n=1 Tax=Apodospora peruviana TaxID=516989 RepID=A0AAE0M0E5_9PEZI|nr:hypothetical protein B0H66DRAFT_563013 [Apodospora peruviana]
MPPSQSRGAASTIQSNGIIFLAGGLPNGTGDSLDIVSAYNVSSESWIELPSQAARLPAARDHAGHATIDGKFYVLGGRKNGGTNVQDTVFILDVNDLEAGWRTSEAKMPTPRSGIAAAALGNKIYTFGGEINPAPGSRGVFTECEVYDTVADSWERLPAMQVPRHGTSAAGVGGRIYIPGGAVQNGMGGVDVFDVFTP